jgi:hypothetical protein
MCVQQGHSAARRLGLGLVAFLLVGSAGLAQSAATDPFRDLLVGDWLVIGPFGGEAGGALTDETPLEEDVERLSKLRPNRAWKALGDRFRHVDGQKRGWRLAPMDFAETSGRGVFETGPIDLARACEGYGSSKSASCFLYLAIEAPTPRAVTVTFGSDDGARLWLNGALLVERDVSRRLKPTADTVVLPLRAGRNHLVVKVSNTDDEFAFQMAHAPPVPYQAVNRAIDGGVKLLLDRQLIDGSWQDFAGEFPHGQTALSVYTLLKCGIAKDHPSVVRALSFLRAGPTAKTYSAGCLLMALAAADRPEDREWMEELTADLVSWQRGDGGWAYPAGGASDLSNVQYAILGLRAAASVGIDVRSKVWESATDYVLSCRSESLRVGDGYEAGFGYRPGRAPTGSMTTAGISVLAIVRDQLANRLKGRDRGRLERGIEEGAFWIGSHFSVRNPGRSDWHRYYLYGVERAGALLPAPTFGGRDWYTEGANNLVAEQKADGSWRQQRSDGLGPSSLSDTETCFALLFLRRATGTAVTQGESGGQPIAVYRSEPESGAIGIQVSTQGGTTISVRRLDAKPEDPKPTRVRFLVRQGDDDAWRELATAEAPRLATRTPLPGSGTWTTMAEVELSDGTVLKSGTVTFPVHVQLAEAMPRYGQDAATELLASLAPRCVASSSRAKTSPESLVDSRSFTAWLCAKDDKTPTVSFKWNREVAVETVLFTHARNRIGELPGPRPARLEIRFDDDSEPLILEVGPEWYRKAELQLPRSRKVRSLEVRIVALHGGTLGAANAGFAAVELLAPDR